MQHEDGGAYMCEDGAAPLHWCTCVRMPHAPKQPIAIDTKFGLMWHPFDQGRFDKFIIQPNMASYWLQPIWPDLASEEIIG